MRTRQPRRLPHCTPPSRTHRSKDSRESAVSYRSPGGTLTTRRGFVCLSIARPGGRNNGFDLSGRYIRPARPLVVRPMLSCRHEGSPRQGTILCRSFRRGRGARLGWAGRRGRVGVPPGAHLTHAPTRLHALLTGAVQRDCAADYAHFSAASRRSPGFAAAGAFHFRERVGGWLKKGARRLPLARVNGKPKPACLLPACPCESVGRTLYVSPTAHWRPPQPPNPLTVR